jgi:hypothetical protein
MLDQYTGVMMEHPFSQLVGTVKNDSPDLIVSA